MTKFNELPIVELIDIAYRINTVFVMYGLDDDSKNAFWESVNIGNKKMEMA